MLTDNTNYIQRPLPITINGILQYYDPTRLKLLSVYREKFQFSLNHSNISGFRFLTTGQISTNVNGYPLIRNGVITSIIANCSKNTRANFYIRKNNNPSNLITLSLYDQNKNSIDNLNIDFLNNDYLQCCLSVNSNFTIDYPIVLIEIAWS